MMQTIYVHELRQYSISKDSIECAWVARYEEPNGEEGKILVTGELSDRHSPSAVLKALSDLTGAWEALGRPKTLLRPMAMKGLGRRLAITVQGHFVRSIEEMPDQ